MQYHLFYLGMPVLDSESVFKLMPFSFDEFVCVCGTGERGGLIKRGGLNEYMKNHMFVPSAAVFWDVTQRSPPKKRI